ncbi:enoyl-CoA hydratase/isomerase family protein [Actinomadura geliboluensis]
MTGGTVELSVDDRIATISIDNAERLNTLSTPLMHDLIEAVETVHHAPDVWVAILRAEGHQAFCAGRDLHEVGISDTSETVPDSQPMRGLHRNLFEVIVECSKPVVAAIFGHTLGGGAELAIASDIRIAADNLSIGFPEVKRGFGANFASVALPRLIPPGVANDLLYTGRTLNARQALDIHLVNAVVPTAELDGAAKAYAKELRSNAPLTLRRYKAMAVRSQGLPLAAALRLDASPNPYLSQDRREGVAAFLEKRPARWTAR